jgi:branched-chain amino acid aminotransferase
MLVEPRSDHCVWLDGEFVPWAAATMHVSDHHYGVGVFEGVRAYAVEGGAAIFRLHEHTARLLRSAHILNITLPAGFDRERLNRAQVELLQRNGLKDAYLRPFVFHTGPAGLAPRVGGLRVRVAVMALEWRDDAAFDRSDAAKRGIALRTASFTRQHASSLLAKAKANGNYMNGILAREEAQHGGADDALLLDRDGMITETSGANVFVVRGGALFTPPLESVLEGITRDSIMVLAGMLGISVMERRMTRDELYIADEVFVTGTAAEVTPVRELDGRTIGDGAQGPLTARLQRLYADVTRGRSDQCRDWLTRI